MEQPFEKGGVDDVIFEQPEDEQSILRESSFRDYSGVRGKNLFEDDNQEKEKKTILEEKISQEIKNKGNNSQISELIQSKDISEIEKSLHKSIIETQKESEFLTVRKFPSYDLSEYDTISQDKKVLDKVEQIEKYFLGKPLTNNIINKKRKVGPLLPLHTLIEGAFLYKSDDKRKMNSKYQRLKNKICNYRTVYGDGNCYYRAVMFRYIELLILNKKSDFLKLLIIDISKSFQTEELQNRLSFCKGKEKLEIDTKRIIEVMIVILKLVENNKIVEAHSVFYNSLTMSECFDLSLILYFRYLLYDYIKQNEKKLYSSQFPVILGNLLPSNYEKDGVFDYKSFYENYLLKMFIPAEKIIIYLTPYVLGINLNVILFDDNEDQILKEFNFVGEDMLQIAEKIYVINIKRHYEIIFDYLDNKNFNYVYRFYRNDIKNYFITIDPHLFKICQLIKQLKDNQNTVNPDKQKYIKKESENGSGKDRNENKLFTPKNDRNNITEIHNPHDQKDPLFQQVIDHNNITYQGNGQYFNRTPTKSPFMPSPEQESFLKEHELCVYCFLEVKEPRKTLKNICNKCLLEQTVIQSKEYYINYLKSMREKINQATKDDLKKNFENIICINFDDNKYTIAEIIQEYNYKKDLNKTEEQQFLSINDLLPNIKKNICLYCYKNTNDNTQFKIPCGCNFCCKEHICEFFKNIVGNKLTYNYKCLCTDVFKHNDIFQLCRILYDNELYSKKERFITHLENIFKMVCCKCGYSNRINLIHISVNEDFFHNFIHSICDTCKNSTNGYILNNCLICNKNHKYICLGYL